MEDKNHGDLGETRSIEWRFDTFHGQHQLRHHLTIFDSDPTTSSFFLLWKNVCAEEICLFIMASSTISYKVK